MPPRPFPDVTILVVTYNRPDELLRTTDHFSNIHYSGKIRVLIADDASTNWPPRFKARLESYGYDVLTHAPTNWGWGRNVNTALNQIDTEFVYFTEDDYLLRQPLNLDIGVALMLTTDVAYLRYRGIAGDQGVDLRLKETDISAYFPALTSRFMLPGKLPYFEILPSSSSLWLYTNGPHLKRRTFHHAYGLYPTGLKLGETEERFCHQVKDKMRSDPSHPRLAILPNWIAMHYEHIGKSFQHTEADR